MDFAQIIQSQTTSIVLLDSALCIRYLNESAEVLLNMSLNRVDGRQLSDLIHDDQLLLSCRKVFSDRGERRLRNHRLPLLSLNREVQVDCIVNLVTLPNQILLMLELRELEAIEKIVQDQNLNQRHQSNQAVMRGLAHEIRNPLGGIKGAAQLLADEIGDAEYREYTEIIIKETNRLTNLVERMQANTVVDLDQPVNIHSVIEHVRRLILAEANGEYSVMQDYDPSLPMVRGNFELLVQAVINVLRNAVEAAALTDETGQILLRTRIDHLALEGLKKQVVRVDVRDNGSGVDPQLDSRIFDPMITNKPEGTGLGLPITAEIVAQHGGAIDYESHSGQTTFRLFLPVFTPPSACFFTQ